MTGVGGGEDCLMMRTMRRDHKAEEFLADADGKFRADDSTRCNHEKSRDRDYAKGGVSQSG